MTTFAPATAAPDLSVTVPLIYPVSCARKATGTINAASEKASVPRIAPRQLMHNLAKMLCFNTTRPPREFREWRNPGSGRKPVANFSREETVEDRRFIRRIAPPLARRMKTHQNCLLNRVNTAMQPCCHALHSLPLDPPPAHLLPSPFCFALAGPPSLPLFSAWRGLLTLFCGRGTVLSLSSPCSAATGRNEAADT